MYGIHGAVAHLNRLLASAEYVRHASHIVPVDVVKVRRAQSVRWQHRVLRVKGQILSRVMKDARGRRPTFGKPQAKFSANAVHNKLAVLRAISDPRARRSAKCRRKIHFSL